MRYLKNSKNENYDKNVEINQLLYEKEDNNSIQTIGIPEKDPSIEMISETSDIIYYTSFNLLFLKAVR